MDALFTWGDKKDDAPPSNNGGAPAGADPSATPSYSAVADHAGRAAAEAARAAAAASPRKRGRPRADGSGSARDQRALQAQIDSAVVSQLDALHDPEAWGALLALPGDAAHAITGRDRWEIKKEERRTLGVTGSAFARTLMITNPRALAAMMLAASMFAVYGTRALAELKDYRARSATRDAVAPEEKKPDVK